LPRHGTPGQNPVAGSFSPSNGSAVALAVAEFDSAQATPSSFQLSQSRMGPKPLSQMSLVNTKTAGKWMFTQKKKTSPQQSQALSPYIDGGKLRIRLKAG